MVVRNVVVLVNSFNLTQRRPWLPPVQSQMHRLFANGLNFLKDRLLLQMGALQRTRKVASYCPVKGNQDPQGKYHRYPISTNDGSQTAVKTRFQNPRTSPQAVVGFRDVWSANIAIKHSHNFGSVVALWAETYPCSGHQLLGEQVGQRIYQFHGELQAVPHLPVVLQSSKCCRCSAYNSSGVEKDGQNSALLRKVETLQVIG